MKYVLVVGFLVIAAIGLGGWQVVRGMQTESRISLYGRFFPELVTRAIQLQTLGEIGVPNEYWNRKQFPEIAEFAKAKTYLPSFNSQEPINCNLRLVLRPVNLKERYPVISFTSSIEPLIYYVLFYGSAPDISPFFDEKTNKDLIGEIVRFEDTKPQRNENGALLNGVDITLEFRRIQSIFPDGLAWEAVECKEFSYFEFREAKK